MLKQIINIIKDTALRHKLIQSFKYQDNLLINAQGCNKYLQCIVDDTSYHQLLISQSPNVFTATFDIYILGFVPTDKTILDVQNECYDVSIQLINKLEDYQGALEVHDYSIMTLSHYTDDDAVGTKISLELRIPFALCDLDEWFDDEPKEETTDDKIISIDSNKPINKPISLNPVRLKP